MDEVKKLSRMLTTSQTARLLDLSAERVRQLVEKGEFESVIMTQLGTLFDPAEVHQLAAERRRRK